MSASKYDFSIEQGSSFRLAIVYKDKDNNIVDITDWCARLTWKTNTGLTQVFNSDNIDTSSYSFSIDGPEGKITLLLPSSTTNNFNFGTARYDLELGSDEDLYAGGGKYTTRILYGTVNIVKRFSQYSDQLEC